jgi:hypothetical protein
MELLILVVVEEPKVDGIRRPHTRRALAVLVL